MYIPILKNRTVEMSVLDRLARMNVFADKVVPLVELIQEKTRSNNKNSAIDDLLELLDEVPNMSLMVDVIKSTKLNNTTDAIRNYITVSTRQSDFCIQEISKFKKYNNRVIPVVSYLTEAPSLERISYEAEAFRREFPKLAFRIKTQDFENIFSHVESLIKENDIVLLDIESASYTNPVFKKLYGRIADSRKSLNFISIILNSNRPDSLTNKEMADKEPIAKIDNGLKELYSITSMRRFDGFGDYAGIVSSLPSTGGSISPAGIFYSNDNNYFVAYKGRAPILSEFPLYIAPSIIDSEYWNEYEDEHHDVCPGCQEILSIVKGEKSGKNQAQWKMIMMLHYIYTVFEAEK